ncbi:hypothetical protein GCM10010321_88300 [Streptomyces chartreusis]|nr:hypothetical protein GCM10010321_88300 [Streptomyces chartreusis]
MSTLGSECVERPVAFSRLSARSAGGDPAIGKNDHQSLLGAVLVMSGEVLDVSEPLSHIKLACVGTGGPLVRAGCRPLI